MFGKARYSAHCSSSLCLKREFCSGFHWEDISAHDLGIIAESFEECVRRLLTWNEAMEEKGLSKCRKDKDQYLCHRPGRPAELNQVSMWSVVLEWAATAYSETAASTGCSRNAEGSSAWQRTLITDVLSARELHVAWTADHRGKSKSNLSSWRWYLPLAT